MGFQKHFHSVEPELQAAMILRIWEWLPMLKLTKSDYKLLMEARFALEFSRQFLLLTEFSPEILKGPGNQ